MKLDSIKRSKLLLIGSNGKLGKELIEENRKNNYFEIIGLSKNQGLNTSLVCDATNFKNLYFCIKDLEPEIIINCAALTDVDYCENNRVDAFKVNSLIPFNIAHANKKLTNNPIIVQISTDQLYKSSEFTDFGDEEPINIYSESKLLGDSLIQEIDKSCIVRTNFLFKEQINWLREKCNSHKEFFLFEDVFCNPIEISNAANIIFEVIKKKLNGVYNLGSCTGMSKAKIFSIIADKLSLDYSKAKFISIDEVKLLANRPKNMTSSVVRLEKELGVSLPTLDDSIEKLIDSYKKDT